MWGLYPVSTFAPAMSSTIRILEYPLNKFMGRVQTHVSRNQAGVQPFMRNRGPSSRRLVRMIWTSDFIHPRFCQISDFDEYQSRMDGFNLRLLNQMMLMRSVSCS